MSSGYDNDNFVILSIEASFFKQTSIQNEFKVLDTPLRQRLTTSFLNCIALYLIVLL